MANHDASPGSSPYLSLEIADDALSAVLHAAPRPSGKAPPTVLDLKRFLAEQGVTHGVHQDRLLQLAEALRADPDRPHPILIAEGTPPGRSHPGRIEYRFNTAPLIGTLRDSDRMDYRERATVNNVRAGDLLAIAHPPVPGEPGIDVRGNRLPPPDAAAPPGLPTGKCVERIETAAAIEYRAREDGHARLSFGILEVTPGIEIAGDVDYAWGNIDFLGDVLIKGSIKSGFSVTCEGDIHVCKDLEPGARAQAGGTLIVDGAIRVGKEKGLAAATRDIYSRCIEGSHVRASGSVIVKELIIDSRIQAQGKVLVKEGHIRGSVVEGVEGIVAWVVGSPSGIRNQLTAGIAQAVLDRLREIEQRMAALDADARQVYQQFERQYGAYAALAAADFQRLSPAEQESFREAKRIMGMRQDKLFGEIEALRAEREEMLAQRKECPDATVAITGDLHPPCLLRIGTGLLEVGARRLHSVTFGYDPARGTIVQGTPGS